MNAHELKSLQSQLTRLQEERAVVLSEVSSGNRKLRSLDANIAATKNKISYAESDKTLIVSEHAMLRYIERVMGFDLEAIRQKVLGCPSVTNCPNGSFPIGDTHQIKVKNNTVTTVIGRV